MLLERAIGGAATLVLAAVGFLLAVGHYDVGAYLWIEAFFVVATIVLGFLLFSRRARPLLKLGRPVLAWVRLDKLVARVYHAMHSYRDHVGVLFAVFVDHARRPGGPRAGRLAQRQGGRDRSLAAARTT